MKEQLLQSKTCLLSVIMLISAMQLHAQGLALAWAKGMGGLGSNHGRSIAKDPMGNVYITGDFAETVAFAPGISAAQLTSNGNNDAFILKMDAGGKVIWVKNVGGPGNDNGYSIAADDSGNVYTTGVFEGTADFDPGPATAALTCDGIFFTDMFIVKLDKDGKFVWAKNIGGVNNIATRSLSIALDRKGNLYTTGTYMGTLNFNGGKDIISSGGDGDVFIYKADLNGNYLWAKGIGGKGYDLALSLTADTLDNVYVTGEFQDTVDFDPGMNKANLIAGFRATFICKLNTDGNYVWAKVLKGNPSSYSYPASTAITLDPYNNVYIAGTFSDSTDFDPGSGTAFLFPVEQSDAYLLKLDADGNYLWVQNIGGSGSSAATSVATDAAANVYTAGFFSDTITFNPGGTALNYVAENYRADIFIQKLNAKGNFLLAKVIGGTGEDAILGITVDNSGNLFTTGYFEDTLDADPGSGITNIISNDYRDIFVLKFSCADTLSVQLPMSICGETYTLNGTTYTSSGTYIQKWPNISGCDSTIILNLSLNIITPAQITVNGFQLGTVVHYTSYQWLFNEIVINGAIDSTYKATHNGVYSVVVTDAAGCSDTSDPYTINNAGDVAIGNINTLATQIIFYPNPAQNRINIQSSIPLNISICSLEGKIIAQHKKVQVIDISNLAPGTYLIQVYDENNAPIKVEKLTKLK